LPTMIVEAESGPIGGSASHEFMVPSPTGEDTILTNDQGYAANVEKCVTGFRSYDTESDPTGELEEIETPECNSIDELCKRWPEFGGSKLKPKNVLKTRLYKDLNSFTAENKPIWVLAVVRGDHEFNDGKVSDSLVEKFTDGTKTIHNLVPAEDAEAKKAGFVLGYLGPHASLGRNDVRLVIDYDAMNGGFWVVGANKCGYHVRHFCWKRDHDVPGAKGFNFLIADIRNAIDGDPAPEDRGGGTLRAQKGIEVGHVFKLGSKYTDAMNVTVTDENNQPAKVLMGCYGIGVNRILAAAIERAPGNGSAGGHDDGGIIWPRAIAPFDVLITTIKYQPGNAVAKTACGFAEQLEAQGYTVLIDDRDERPGPKFNDADLIGIPLRITVGEKGLGQSPPAVDLKARNGSNGPKGETVPAEQAVARAAELLAGL